MRCELKREVRIPPATRGADKNKTFADFLAHKRSTVPGGGDIRVDVFHCDSSSRMMFQVITQTQFHYQGSKKKATTYPELTLIPCTWTLLNFLLNVAVLSQVSVPIQVGKRKMVKAFILFWPRCSFRQQPEAPRHRCFCAQERKCLSKYYYFFQLSTGRAGLCFTLPDGAFLVILFFNFNHSMPL